MGYRRRVIGGCVAALLSGAASADPGPYFGVGFCAGDLDIDQSSFPSANFDIGDQSGDTFVLDVSGGYRWDNNWTADLALTFYTPPDFGIFGDPIDLNVYKLGGGYRFPSRTRLNAFIKGGVAYWDLRLTESFLFNPGPEESATRTGTNPYAEFGVEFQVFGNMAARLSYEVGSYDFGDVRAGKLWFGANF